MSKTKTIKVYHGFGYENDLELFGHAVIKRSRYRNNHSRNKLAQLVNVLRLFFVKYIPFLPVKMNWGEQEIKGHTEYDGFFKLEWKSDSSVPAGWHTVEVNVDSGDKINTGKGEIFVPHQTQYGFISDIDDTIMISHSATIWKRLNELLFKGPENRSLFDDVALHYELLAKGNVDDGVKNPFFYVSSSEWNLYDYLVSIFKKNKLPDGVFLLSQAKRWFELWKTGKTKHEGKLLRILRVFDKLPHQKFVLIGDNSQSDPEIYAKLSEKYGDRIYAVYIRNVRAEKVKATEQHLSSISQKNIHTLFFRESSEAIDHSRQIGLITTDCIVSTEKIS